MLFNIYQSDTSLLTSTKNLDSSNLVYQLLFDLWSTLVKCPVLTSSWRGFELRLDACARIRPVCPPKQPKIPRYLISGPSNQCEWLTFRLSIAIRMKSIDIDPTIRGSIPFAPSPNAVTHEKETFTDEGRQCGYRCKLQALDVSASCVAIQYQFLKLGGRAPKILQEEDG